MANLSDAITAEVEALFNRLRANPFKDQDTEAQTRLGEPTAWVGDASIVPDTIDQANWGGPTYVGTGTGVTAGGGLGVDFPNDLVVGDLLVLHVAGPSGIGGDPMGSVPVSGSVSADDGWTVYPGLPDLELGGEPPDVLRAVIWTKRYDGVDIGPAGISTPWGGSAFKRGSIHAFRGVASIEGLVHSIGAGYADLPDVGVTATGPGRLALNLWASTQGLGVVPSFAGETGGSWTEIISHGSGSAADYHFGCDLGLQTAPLGAGTIDGGSFPSPGYSPSTLTWINIGIALVGGNTIFDNSGSATDALAAAEAYTDAALVTAKAYADSQDVIVAAEADTDVADAVASLHAHHWNEIPAGTVDGINAAFTLAANPNPAGSLMLYKNGMLQRSGAGNDFTLSSLTVTYEAGNLPQTTDVHVASYTT